MTAYVIFTREAVTDPAELAIYSETAPAAGVGHNATLLALYGEYEVLEGDPIEGAVIVRFPSIAEAKAWYYSPAYQAAVQHRFAGAKYHVFIVEGVD